MTDRSNHRRAFAAIFAGASRSALVAGLIAGASPAFAQQTVPGTDPDCPIVGGVATCTGDQSDGIISNPNDPGFDRIVIENLTGPIAPAGYFGVGVVKEDRDISIEIADDVVISTFDDPGIPGVAQGLIAIVGGGFDLDIDSGAAITADGNGATALGIEAIVINGAGNLGLTNRGDINAFTSGDAAIALSASAENSGGAISVVNSGDLSATSAGVGERDQATAGIRVLHFSGGNNVFVLNSGAITVDAGPDSFDTDFDGIAAGIVTNVFGAASQTQIENRGTISATGNATHGIVGFAENLNPDTPAGVVIINEGAIAIDGFNNYGILGQSRGTIADVTIVNLAPIAMANGGNSTGLFVIHQARSADAFIGNSGAISGSGLLMRGMGITTSGAPARGEYTMEIANGGDITLDAPTAFGMTLTATADDTVAALIQNQGRIDLSATTDTTSRGISVNFGLIDANAGGADGTSTFQMTNGGDIVMGAGNAVNIVADSVSITNSGRLSTSGDGSDVVVLNAITGDEDGVASIDFATTGDIVATGANSSGIVATNRDNDGTIAIEIGAGATVSSGTGSGVGIRIQGAEGDPDPIFEITRNITITKAKLADRAMNAVTQFITSSVPPGGDPGFGTFALQPTADFDPARFNRRIDVLGTVRSDGGAGAIQSDASLLVTVDGGALATTGNGAPVIRGRESLALVANGATLTSTGADSPLFGIVPGAETGTATYVNLSGGTAGTTGDNSDAFALGAGVGSSVASFVVNFPDRSGGLATIATTGNGSRAFSFDAAGGSSTLTGIVENALVTTTGDNAAAFDFRVGSQSSVSLAIADSTVSTAGANSDLIFLDIANNSDSLFVFQNATLTTTGANSRILNAPGAAVDNSVANVVMIGSSLRTEGDGSGAIALGGAFAFSAATLFAADTGITTLGDDAAAIDLGRAGTGSVMTITADELIISTSGDRSGGIVGELTGDGSAFQLTMTDTAIATLGADASALGLPGVFGGSSAITVSIGDSRFTTGGDRSHGVHLGGGGQDSSVFSFDIQDTLISTLGAGADALRVDNALADGNSVTVLSASVLDIATAGDGARGIFFGGSLTGDSINSSTTIDLRDSVIGTLGGDAAGVEIAGFTGDMVQSDWTIVVLNIDIATAGAGSTGLGIGGVDGAFDRSTLSRIVGNVGITTQGDDAAGLFVGGLGPMSGSDSSLLVRDTDIATIGARSIGLSLGGVAGDLDASDINRTVRNVSITTQGDDSIGLFVGGIGVLLNGSTADTLLDAITITTAGANAHGILLGGPTGGGDGAYSVSLTDATVATLGAGSAGILFDGLGDDAILRATYSGGAITTEGDDAVGFAVVRPGDNSALVVLLDAIDIATQGGNAHGVHLGGGGQGRSLFRFSFADSVTATAGAAADGVRVSTFLADDSSVSVGSMSGLDIATAGAGAAGIRIGGSATGDSVNSSTSIQISDSLVETLGEDATGIEIAGLTGDFVNSDWTVFVGDTDIATAGAGSIGLSIGGVDGAMNSGSIARIASNVGITTQGDDAIGLFVGGLGPMNGSVATTALDNITIATTGAQAHGLRLGGIDGDSINSSISKTIGEVAIETRGDDASGIEIAGVVGDFLNSDHLLFVGGADISTSGARSTGMSIGGVGGTLGDGSIWNRVISEVAIATTGDDAVGLSIGGQGAVQGGSSAVTFLGDITIATSGANAHGLVLGGGLGGSADNVLTMEDIVSNVSGAGAAALVIGGNTHAAPVNGLFNASGAGGHGVLVRLDAGQASSFTVGERSIVTAQGAGGSGIFVDGAAGAEAGITVVEGGSVTGTETAIAFSGASGNVIVAGGITGESGIAVAFDAGDDRFELQVGGEVTGTVEGGAGANLFALGGTGAASFDFGLVGAQYLDFEAFEKVGGSTWTLTGTNAVVGPFTVREGTLVANGQFAGLNTTVLAGGRLGGTGIVGDVTVTGGTLGAGNSIGTLTVGNLSLDAASTLEVEVSEAAADMIRANGSVALGGSTLSILGVAGANFAGSDSYSYTIVDNDGSDAVGGTFGTILNDLAFLDASVNYAGGDGNDVVLTLDQTRMFPEVAVTFNQRGTASGLAAFDRTPGSDADTVYTELLVMTESQALAAFDAASGEIYASLLTDAAADGHARGRRLAARALEPQAEGWGLWGGFAGRTGAIDGDGNAAKADHGAYGFDLGIDYRGPGNGWAVGISTGYIDGRLDVDGRASRASYDGWHIGGYARWGTGNAGLTVAGAASYARVEAAMRRDIAFGSIARTATGSVDVETVSLDGELRYGLPLGGGWAAGPIASIAYADADLGRFAETGAGSLNLSGAGGSDAATRYGAGAFANWQGARGGIDFSLQYVDGRSSLAEVDLALAGAAATPFSVRSPRADGAAALLGASGRYDLGGNWSLGANVRALVGGDGNDLSGAFTIGWRF